MLFRSYNGESIGVEHEGMAGESLNKNQRDNLEKFFIWAKATHGSTLVYTTDVNANGVIGHGKLGVAGGDHPSCPGEPILADVNKILKGLTKKPVVLKVPPRIPPFVPQGD